MAYKLGAEEREHDVSETASLEKERQVEHGLTEEKRKYLRAGLSTEDADFLLDMPLKEQSRIFHKVDRRVVPMVSIQCMLSRIKLNESSLPCCT